MINVLNNFTWSLFIISGLLLSNYSHNFNSSDGNSLDYKKTYYQSQELVELDSLEQAIMNLNIIINKQRTYQKDDDILIMNSYYDLGQIYLSRSIDYEKASSYFEHIYNNVFSGYETENPSNLKSLSELKEKSLFMLGYIYHNHIGNFSIAEYYYSTFLTKYPLSELYSSVEYELDIIKSEIKKFKR
tara:strand:- start:862 stop:1422 length:561 start_codon:yes stop_codon:yes gene_type:complete